MYENVGNPDFRERLLQRAWDEGDYEEVLRLAKDGVVCDYEYAGLVDDWHKWELKCYRRKNAVPDILRLSRYFFFNGKRFGEDEKEYSMKAVYALMRSVVPAEEWGDFVESLIKEAEEKRDEKGSLFIFTQEKMWERYMEHLRASPSVYSLDDAPQDVWGLYVDELIRLYTAEVRRFFQFASGRKSYRDGVNQLRKLIGYGGRREAYEIIEEQKVRTPRRPALIEELSTLS